MKELTYNERVQTMAERLAKAHNSQMVEMAKQQGINSALNVDWEDLPEGAKKAAIGAHTSRATEAVAGMLEVLEYAYDLGYIDGGKQGAIRDKEAAKRIGLIPDNN